jgi:FkbM family methyltransferase
VNRLSSSTPLPKRIRDFGRELRGASHFAPASRPRYWADAVAYRVLRLAPSLASDRLRTLRLRDGTRISYCLNRGDIQAIREIGFTSVYFARRHGARTCIAVEPDARNVRLLRRNLEQNGINATVFEAAVGSRDGTANFAANSESNLGRLAETGVPVKMLSMRTLLDELGDRRIDLLKVDIEGGEGELFRGSVDDRR